MLAASEFQTSMLHTNDVNKILSSLVIQPHQLTHFTRLNEWAGARLTSVNRARLLLPSHASITCKRKAWCFEDILGKNAEFPLTHTWNWHQITLKNLVKSVKDLYGFCHLRAFSGVGIYLQCQSVYYCIPVRIKKLRLASLISFKL